MNQDPKTMFILIAGIAIGVFLWYLFAKIAFMGKIKDHRKQAVKKSREVVLWHVSEQMAPLLPQFEYNFKDAMFLGKWVDYVVFDGLATWELEEIIFVEVKSQNARQNKNERMIEMAIKRGAVRYELVRI